MGKKSKQTDKVVTQDPRFASLHTDARFIKPKRLTQKVQVDERFKDLLSQTEVTPVDKYGRKPSRNQSKKDLEQFYQLDKGKGKEHDALELARGQVELESSDEEDFSEAEDAEEALEDAELGQAADDLSEYSVNLDEDDLPDAQLSDSEEQEITSKRLAAVNMDWDHLRAQDIYKVFSSVFAASTAKSKGKLVKVSILPSEFGKERLAVEERSGPPPEIFADPDDIDEKTVVRADSGREYNEKALRRYQLERLRYYYAVIEFSSVAAARLAYTEIQGSEFERSSNFFDLRSIPDDMTFDDAPKDEAVEEAVNYEVNDFTTDALRHSKVKLTWDQDDPRRSRLTRLDLTKLSKDELDNMDFSTYLASASDSSGEEEGEEEEGGDAEEGQQPIKRDALRSLLGLDSKPKKSKSKGVQGDMEITFMPALTETDKEAAPVDMDDENALQTYKRKEKERKQRKKEAKAVAAQQDEEKDEFFESDSDAPVTKKRDAAKEAAELALLVSDEDETVPGRHFDMNAIIKQEKLSRSTKRKRNKAKNKQQTEAGPDAFELDAGDSRFAAVHQDPRFAIDPSNPRFKKTKNMDKLLTKAREARAEEHATGGVDKTTGGATDLDKLVQSVKRKSSDVASKKDKGQHKKKREQVSSEALAMARLPIDLPMEIPDHASDEPASLPSSYPKFTTLRTTDDESAAVIKALEKRLVVLKARSGHPATPAFPLVSTSDDENDDRQEVVDVSKDEFRRLLKESDAFASDDEGDLEAPVQQRIPSLKFSEVVRISGGMRSVSTGSRRGRPPSLSRYPSRSSLSSSRSPSFSDATPAQSRATSRRTSVGSDVPIPSSLTTSVFSGGSSPCSSVVSSIMAPLMPASALAPSPSRTLQILQGRSTSASERAYKTLIAKQQQERLAHHPTRRKPRWWQLSCLGRRTTERKPLLGQVEETSDEEPLKTEAEVMFGPRPRRFFKTSYWGWRLRQWARHICGRSETGLDSEEVV